MELKGDWTSVGMGMVLITMIVAMALLLRIPEIFGISFGWGWRTIDGGHREVHALTPKITDVASPDIFLAEGEELVATYDLDLKTGRARMSVYTWGWLPGVGDLEWFHRNPSIHSPTQRRVSLVAPRSGFYKVSGAVVDATGTFSIDWEVRGARWEGQAMRFGRSLTGWFGLLLGVVAIVAVTAALIRTLTE